MNRLRAAFPDPTPGASSAPPGAPSPAGAPVPGPLLLDLLAALLDGGAPPSSALASVGAALAAVGDPRGERLLALAGGLVLGHEHGAGSPASSGPDEALIAALARSLGLAARSGLPPAALIRRAAAEERRRRASSRTRAIRRLEVLMVIPGGLCLLPAFVLLGIVPVVIRLLGG